MAAKGARASEYREGKCNYPLRLTYASIKSQRSGTRLQCDFAGRMASVAAIGSDIFGKCVEGIKVSAELRITGGRLCCGADIGEISEA